MNLVHAIHDSIQGGVVTDGVIGPVQVIVNCSGKADDRDVVLAGEFLRSGQRAVATYYYKGINLVLLDCGVSFGAALDGHELLAA